MSVTITSREFNRDVSAAKRAAEDGPVTITDHGRPSHVLMTFEDYNQMAGSQELVADSLYMPGAEKIELPIPERARHSSLRIPAL